MLDLQVHQQVMSHLASANRKWLDPLVAERVALYVDLPTHLNIGDHLIMLGTERYLETRRVRVLGRRAVFQPLPDLPKDGVVLCHGGGNFGDIYGVHQRFREQIVRRYSRNRIIVLPQTVYFEDPALRDATSAILRAHGDLHLAVRDTASLHIVESMGLEAALVPDMAHHLYPFFEHPHAGAGTLTHLRRDRERRGERQLAGSFDWDDVTDRYRLRSSLHKRWLRLSTLGLRWPSPDAAMEGWVRHSHFLCNKAAGLYAAHERIATDRLHGHILACLMDLPSIAGDNTYGKVHAYIQQWTAGSPLVRLSGSL